MKQFIVKLNDSLSIAISTFYLLPLVDSHPISFMDFQELNLFDKEYFIKDFSEVIVSKKSYQRIQSTEKKTLSGHNFMNLLLKKKFKPAYKIKQIKFMLLNVIHPKVYTFLKSLSNNGLKGRQLFLLNKPEKDILYNICKIFTNIIPIYKHMFMCNTNIMRILIFFIYRIKNYLLLNLCVFISISNLKHKMKMIRMLPTSTILMCKNKCIVSYLVNTRCITIFHPVNNIQIYKDKIFHPVMHKTKFYFLFNQKFVRSFQCFIVFLLIILNFWNNANKIGKKEVTTEFQKEIKLPQQQITNINEQKVLDPEINPIKEGLPLQNINVHITQLELSAQEKIKKIEEEYLQLSSNKNSSIENETLNFKDKLLADTFIVKLKKKQAAKEKLLQQKEEKKNIILQELNLKKLQYEQNNNAIIREEYSGPSMSHIYDRTEIYSARITDELAHDNDKLWAIKQSTPDIKNGTEHALGLEITRCGNCPFPKNKPCGFCGIKINIFRSGFPNTINNENQDLNQPFKKGPVFTISDDLNITNQKKRQNMQQLLNSDNSQVTLEKDDLTNPAWRFFQNGCLNETYIQSTKNRLEAFKKQEENKKKDLESHEIKNNNIKDEN